MSKLIAVAAVMTIAASLAYAEEKKAESTADESAVAKTEAPADKKSAKQAAAEAKAALEKQIAEDPEKVDWSKINWRERLTRMQYHIMREAGTERPHQNKYWDHFKDGEYRCAGCGLPLFESTSKFDSECGWPSFDKTIAKDTVTEQVDHKIGYPRTEIRCRRCDAHLGHVFNDGPTATGLRYCMNSASMKFLNTKQLAVEIKTAKKPKPPTSEAPAEKPKPEAIEEPAAPTTDAKK
jgi:peptide-methionine (R)-S-oxide reductase